jgi:SAM-dependent methyltransferase
MEAPLIPPDSPGHLLYRDVEDLEHGLPIKASYYRNPDSGLIFQHPVPSSEQLRSFYPPDYRPHVSRGLVHQLKMLQAGVLVRKLRDELPGREGSILEIGCGGGHLMMQLQRLGYRELTAMDWEENLRAPVEARGIEFVSGDIEGDLDISASFDRIILNNVIEHLAHPKQVIGRLKALLRPQGRILLLTPNERSLSHRLFGRNWSGLHAPRHVCVFNPDSLKEQARSEGLHTRSRLLLDPSSWAVSLQNLIRDRLRPTPPYPATSWYTLAVLPVCIVPAALEHLFRLSSSMLVVLSADRA